MHCNHEKVKMYQEQEVSYEGDDEGHVFPVLDVVVYEECEDCGAILNVY